MRMAENDQPKQINKVSHGDKQLWHLISKELKYKPNPAQKKKYELQKQVISYLTTCEKKDVKNSPGKHEKS